MAESKLRLILFSALLAVAGSSGTQQNSISR